MPVTDLKFMTFDTPQDMVAFCRGGGLPAIVQTGGNVFPMNLNGLTLVVKISTDGGGTFPTTRTHTFVAANPYANIAAVVADITGDAVFMGADLLVFAVGNELVVKTKVAGNRALKVDNTSTSIGAGKLQYLADQVGNGAVSTNSFQPMIDPSNGKFVLFWV